MNLLIFSDTFTGFSFNICKWSCLLFTWFLPSFSGAQEIKKDTLPEDQRYYLNAQKLIDSARYKEAIPLLKKVIKLNPSSTDAYNKMAYAKIKLKDYKGAEKDLLMSNQIQSMNFETCKLLGMNFYLEGKYKEAKDQLDTALYISKEEKIEDPELHYYRALLMFKGKSYKSALEALESATELEPRYIDAYLLKGEVRFAMKNYNYAIKELTEAINLMSLTKPIYRAYELRAKSYFEMGNYKGAVQDWNVFIEGTPNDEASLISRGAARINCGDNSGAVVDLDAAIKINPKNPVSYCYRGVAKGGNKMYAEAMKDLDYAIKLKFDYAGAFVNRASIKMALKDKRGACEDLSKADSLGDEMALRLFEKYCSQK